MNLEERLERLERSNRRMRVAVTALLAGGLAVALMGQAQQIGVARVKVVELAGDDGVVRGRLGIQRIGDEELCAFVALDKDGEPAAVVGNVVDGISPRLFLNGTAVTNAPSGVSLCGGATPTFWLGQPSGPALHMDGTRGIWATLGERRALFELLSLGQLRLYRDGRLTARLP